MSTAAGCENNDSAAEINEGEIQSPVGVWETSCDNQGIYKSIKLELAPVETPCHFLLEFQKVLEHVPSAGGAEFHIGFFLDIGMVGSTGIDKNML